MLLKCEIDKNAKRVRNHCENFVILSDLILILRVFNKFFFKKFFEHICYVINIKRVISCQNRKKKSSQFHVLINKIYFELQFFAFARNFIIKTF